MAHMKRIQLRNILVLLGIVLSAGYLDASDFQPSLKAVLMLIRHGDRAPQYSYPNDPYKDFAWPGGYGALSSLGAYQLYHSGQLKANRYSSLLTSSFNVEKIFVRSSATQRCVDSAYSFLEAFLPVRWPLDLVNITPSDEDEFLGIAKMCSNYMWQYTGAFDYKIPAYSQVLDFDSNEGNHFLEYLEKNSGYGFDKFYVIHDTIKIQLDNGLPIPEWAEPIYEKYLVPLSKVGMDVWSTTQLMRIRNGVFIREIMNRFDSFLSNTSAPNIILYSGHDLNIAGLMHLLDIKDQAPGSPKYGATVSFEIYDNILVSNDVEIRIIYFRSYEDEEPIEMEIPGCGAPCAYKKFKESVIGKYIWNHDEACSE